MTDIYLFISSNVCGEVKIENSNLWTEPKSSEIQTDFFRLMRGCLVGLTERIEVVFPHGFLSPNYNILYVFPSCHPGELSLTRKVSQSSDGKNLALSLSLSLNLPVLKPFGSFYWKYVEFFGRLYHKNIDHIVVLAKSTFFFLFFNYVSRWLEKKYVDQTLWLFYITAGLFERFPNIVNLALFAEGLIEDVWRESMF